MDIAERLKIVGMCKEDIEGLIIEKLGQLENGELEDDYCAKELALKINENPRFRKIYEDYKNEQDG